MWSTFSFNKINLYFLYGLLDFLFFNFYMVKSTFYVVKSTSCIVN